MRKRRRHSIVFETAGGIETFVLQIEAIFFHTDKRGNPMCLLKNRLTFADGDAPLQRQEWEQIMKSPNSAQPVWRGTFLPKLFKMLERFRRGNAVPIILNIKKFAANGAGMQNLFDSELLTAHRIDTLLKNRHAYILMALRQNTRAAFELLSAFADVAARRSSAYLKQQNLFTTARREVAYRVFFF
jgi:hypothetical protein